MKKSQKYRKKVKWTQSMREYIVFHYKNKHDYEIAAELSRLTNQNITDSMVEFQRRQLNTKKVIGRYHKPKTD